jgi:hypothetical protein
MGRMKDYWAFAQELRDLSTEALHDMLRTETDWLRTELIESELESRNATP